MKLLTLPKNQVDTLRGHNRKCPILRGRGIDRHQGNGKTHKRMLHKNFAHGSQRIMETKADQWPTVSRASKSLKQDCWQKNEASWSLHPASRAQCVITRPLAAIQRYSKQRQTSTHLHRQPVQGPRCGRSGRNQIGDEQPWAVERTLKISSSESSN